MVSSSRLVISQVETYVLAPLPALVELLKVGSFFLKSGSCMMKAVSRKRAKNIGCESSTFGRKSEACSLYTTQYSFRKLGQKRLGEMLWRRDSVHAHCTL